MEDISIVGFLILVALVEALVETVKWLFVVPPDETYVLWKRVSLWKLMTLLASVALSVAMNTDLLAFIGVPMAFPVVGSVLTGILLARGANILNDIVGLAKPKPTFL